MARHIQINPVRPRVQFRADGVRREFLFPFAIFAAANLEVYLESERLTSGFTVQGVGESDGGSITFASPPPAGAVVTLRRRLIMQRTTDFQESGPFRARVLNDELDYLSAAIQQLEAEIERAVRLAPADVDSKTILPNVTERAGRAVAFDNNGDLTVILPNELGQTGQVGWRSLDEIPEGAEVRRFTAAEKAKLASIEDEAQKNSPVVSAHEKALANEPATRSFSPKDVADMVAIHAPVYDHAVASVHGRSGAVVAQAGDYTAEQIAETAERVVMTTAERAKLAGVETGAGANAVASVHGRSGAVVAQAGDYTAEQIAETAERVVMTTAERAKLAGVETGAGANAVASVHGRSGAVVAQAGDYTANQIAETAERVVMTAAERAKLASVDRAKLEAYSINDGKTGDVHATLTNNPHNTTAAQVGAPTEAEFDALSAIVNEHSGDLIELDGRADALESSDGSQATAIANLNTRLDAVEGAGTGKTWIALPFLIKNAQVFTNLPAGPSLWTNTLYQKVSLWHAEKIFFWCNIGAAGAAGNYVRCQYTTDLTNKTGWTDISGADIPLDAISQDGRISATVEVPSGAKTQEFVLLRAVGGGGNGTTNPTISFFQPTALQNTTSIGGGSGIASFNGRAGLVIPASGDYNYDQISETATGKKYTATEKTKLAGIESQAQVNTVTSVHGRTGVVVAQAGDYTAEQIAETAERVVMTAAERAKLAGVEVGAGANAVASVHGRTGVVVAQAGDYTAEQIAETAARVVMTVAERAKLAGVENNAQANPPRVTSAEKSNAASTVVRGFAPADVRDMMTALAPPAPVTSVAGRTGAIALTKADVGLSAVTDNAQIRADLLYPTKAAPASGDKLVIKDQSDGQPKVIDWNQLPSGSGAVSSVHGRIGVVIGQAGDYTADEITDTAAKVLMTAAERTKLGGVAVGAQVNPTRITAAEKTAGTSVTLRGFAPVDVRDMVTAFAPSGAVTSVAGRVGAVTLSKADVGLGNVSNDAQIRADLLYSAKAAPASGDKLVIRDQSDGLPKIIDWNQLPSGSVTAVHGRTGAVVAASGDYDTGQVTEVSDKKFVTDAEKAKLANVPSDTNASLAGKADGAATTAALATKADAAALTAALASKAPLASPGLTGSPTAPTPTTGDNSTKIATTAFVKAQNYLTSVPPHTHAIANVTGLQAELDDLQGQINILTPAGTTKAVLAVTNADPVNLPDHDAIFIEHSGVNANVRIPASWTKKPHTLVFLGNPNTCNVAIATGSGQTIKGATSGGLTFTSGTDAAAVTRTLIPDPDTTAFPNRWRIF